MSSAPRPKRKGGFIRRRRVCRFCAEKIDYIDYKDVKLLGAFIPERGKILPHNHPLTRMVDGVLQQLIPQVAIEGADWKVHVIQDDGMVNAFVLPGYVVPDLWC